MWNADSYACGIGGTFVEGDVGGGDNWGTKETLMRFGGRRTHRMK